MGHTVLSRVSSCALLGFADCQQQVHLEVPELQRQVGWLELQLRTAALAQLLRTSLVFFKFTTGSQRF